MQNILRFHKDLGFPKVELPNGSFFLRYSRHAEDATLNDKHGAIDLPIVLNTQNAEVIELKLNPDGSIFRIVYRTHHNADTDVSMVVQPQGAALFVVTVWLNAVADHHKTLDKSAYLFPQNVTFTA